MAQAVQDEVRLDRPLDEAAALDRRVGLARLRVLPVVVAPQQQVGAHEDGAHLVVACRRRDVAGRGGHHQVAAQPSAVHEHKREEELPHRRVARKQQLLAAKAGAAAVHGERLQPAPAGLPLVQLPLGGCHIVATAIVLRRDRGDLQPSRLVDRCVQPVGRRTHAWDPRAVGVGGAAVADVEAVLLRRRHNVDLSRHLLDDQRLTTGDRETRTKGAAHTRFVFFGMTASVSLSVFVTLHQAKPSQAKPR